MNKIFDNLDEYILKDSPDEIFEYKGKKFTKKELVDKARTHRDNATTIVTNFIEKSTMDYRYNMIQDITSTLYSRFWDASFKDFWSSNNKFKNKEMWQTFIAAEQIKGDKTKIATGIATVRNALTYTGYDRNNIMHEYIDKLDGIIPPDDTAGYKIIDKLKWFARHPECLVNNKELFMKEITKLKNYKITTADKNLAKTQEECKAAYIDIVSGLIGDNTTGEIQDMLSIYYKIAPFKMEKLEAELAVKKLVKSFDKSVNLECVEFFDKVRDLKLGSAPTDILTILFSFIALSTGLGYAHDKDKRISIMYRSGIPLIGGLATTILTASRLVSGGKSLALGFLSAIILNQFGKIADNMRETGKYTHS